eukprot:3985698-Amphidinium_carterae.1
MPPHMNPPYKSSFAFCLVLGPLMLTGTPAFRIWGTFLAQLISSLAMFNRGRGTLVKPREDAWRSVQLNMPDFRIAVCDT